MSPSERARELTELYLDGMLSEPERRELETLLRQEEETKRYFLEAARLHGLLRVSLKTSAAGEPRERIGRRRRGLWCARTTASTWAAAVAVAGIFVVIVLFVAHGSSGSNRETREMGAAGRKTAPKPPGAGREAVPDEERRQAAEERGRAEERLREIEQERERLLAKPVPPEYKPDPGKEEERRKALSALEGRKRAIEEEMKAAIEREKATLTNSGNPALQRPVPAPEAPQEKKPREGSHTTVAKVGRVEGEAYLIVQGEKKRVGAGQEIGAGQGIETGGGTALVEIFYLDQTRLEVGAETALRELKAEGGKKLSIEKGVVRALVAKQPKGEPMVFETPHAEAKVLGTTLRIVVDPDPKKGTRLEVEEGKVQLKTLAGKSVDVPSGHYAVAAAGVDLAVRLFPRVLLSETFENPLGALSRWVPVKRGFPVTLAGRLGINLSPRPQDAYPDGWHQVGGGARSVAAFRLPLRISVDVEWTEKHEDLHADVILVPSSGKDDKDSIFVRRFHSRGGLLELGLLERGLGDETLLGSQEGFPWQPRERWIVEVEGDEVRVSAGQKVLLKARHGRKAFDAYQVLLCAHAKLGVPQGARVSFDNLIVQSK